MNPMLNIAIKAARNAGNIITRALERLDTIEIVEKARNDFVTDIDHQAERAIISVIRQAYPNHAILAEESGEHEGDDFCWVIDPLDGTSNFIHGIPHFAISIALRHKGILDQAVIYEPVGQELFTASKGNGAMLNNRRIRVSQQKLFAESLIGTDFPYRSGQSIDLYQSTLTDIMPKAGSIRCPGAAALDLAYVAAGRFDGYWGMGLSPWDIAAGILLIREAGGLVGDLEGGEGYFETGNIVAGSPKVFKALLQQIRPCLEKHESAN